MKIPDFIEDLQFIFRPNFWLMSRAYSEKWDKELNKLLDENEFVLETRYMDDHYWAILGDKRIWIKNHPYASFLDGEPLSGKRPSRKTILRAYELHIS